MKTHGCIKKINMALAIRNARLLSCLQLKKSPTRIFVATEKVDSKNRDSVPLLSANFCPFCGESLLETPSGRSDP